MQKKALILFLFLSLFGYSQTFIPEITARVDTTNTAIKEVYHLYKNYINSKPDSIYKNPFWNETQAIKMLKSQLLKVDRSAEQMYNTYASNDYLSYYNPKIIQIDSLEVNRFQIKTIFSHDAPEEDYKKFTPTYITKLYATRDSNGVFKLENVIDYDTKNWKKYTYKFINYVVHPNCTFDKKEAKNAVSFCEKIAKQFSIKIIPFTYYILPNSDEMGKLYNFEYWMSYMGGQTIIPNREIFTTFGNASYPHEFVHILFPLPKNNQSYCPKIINEGFATWLAGPNMTTTFEKALKETSFTFKKQQKISLEDIMTFKFRNEFDNSILYVTGGVICQLVYEKQGEKGIWELYNATDETFISVLEKLFNEPYEKIESQIINYITNYN